MATSHFTSIVELLHHLTMVVMLFMCVKDGRDAYEHSGDEVLIRLILLKNKKQKTNRTE